MTIIENNIINFILYNIVHNNAIIMIILIIHAVIFLQML